MSRFSGFAAVPACVLACTAMAGAPSSVVGADGFGAGVSAAALASMRGGTEITENMTLHGNVDDNHADHVTSGDNRIAGGAFAGAVGVPMVIQNTGNNVLIQNATIINVQFQP